MDKVVMLYDFVERKLSITRIQGSAYDLFRYLLEHIYIEDEEIWNYSTSWILDYDVYKNKALKYVLFHKDKIKQIMDIEPKIEYIKERPSEEVMQYCPFVLSEKIINVYLVYGRPWLDISWIIDKWSKIVDKDTLELLKSIEKETIGQDLTWVLMYFSNYDPEIKTDEHLHYYPDPDTLFYICSVDTKTGPKLIVKRYRLEEMKNIYTDEELINFLINLMKTDKY